MRSKAKLLLFNFMLIQTCVLMGCGKAQSNPTAGTIFEEKRMTFSVVLPNLSDISKQEDIVPFLKTSNGNKIQLPTNVPFYLRNGKQVDSSYIGFKGYTVDVICESFENDKLSNVKKIIINQTHDEVEKYFYYLGEVHSFGKYHFFTIETNDENSSINGNYSLELFGLKNINLGKHIFAGLPSNGRANHIAKLEIFDSEDGEEMYASIWDYGEILFE